MYVGTIQRFRNDIRCNTAPACECNVEWGEWGGGEALDTELIAADVRDKRVAFFVRHARRGADSFYMSFCV